MARIKKNDQVIVIAGKDKGKTGRVLKVIPETNRVIVEGVGRVTKHTKVGQSANGSRTAALRPLRPRSTPLTLCSLTPRPSSAPALASVLRRASAPTAVSAPSACVTPRSPGRTCEHD